MAACLALAAALASAAAWNVRPARAQEVAPLTVSRNQFAGQAGRPAPQLPPGAPVTVRDERWQVRGTDTLRVTSPDPQLAAVLRLGPATGGAGPASVPPGTALRLTVIVIAAEGARRHQYKGDGTVLRDGAPTPQRFFRVGRDGLETALSGTPGQVTEIVIQDDGDVELRLRQEGAVLELSAVPPAHGGLTSGTGPPHYTGQPLRFAEIGLLAAGYTDNGLGELWLGGVALGRADGFFTDEGDTTLLRGGVAAQAWRSERFALWAEGGVGWYRSEDTSVAPVEVTEETRVAGAATLHWRYGDWGAVLHAGLVGDATVLAAYGGWQAWRWLGLVIAWHSFEGRSGFGLGATVGF